MLDLFNSLINTVRAVVDFAIHTVESLFTFVSMIPTYVTFLGQSVNVLPSLLLPFVTVCISVYVVLFLINRK